MDEKDINKNESQDSCPAETDSAHTPANDIGDQSACPNVPPAPPMYNQWQQPPMPPKNAYTYYSDGTSKHAPPRSYNGYGAAPSGASSAPYRSKSSTVLISLSAFLLVMAIILTSVIFIYGNDVNDDNDSESNAALDNAEFVADSGSNDGNSLPTGQDSSTVDSSVPDYVGELPSVITTAPVPENSYDSLVELYSECSLSCVTIICTVEINYGYYVREGQSLGSGFVIESTLDGEYEGNKYIITNHHVIEDAKDITVRFYDNTEYEATLIASDEATDLAVLAIDKDDMIALEMGDSNELCVGQWVVAIGTPSDAELAGTMSYGIVSGVNRKLDITNDYGTVIKTMTVIQTTATLNPGNSGGPLINMSGQVVGINAMKLTDDYEGIGFALPSTSAVDIINSLIVYGDLRGVEDIFVESAAQLGITCMDVSDDIIDQYHLGEDCPYGILVAEVTPGTAVYEAGLSQFDVITSFNGTTITTYDELKAILSEARAGTTVEMTFYRPNRRGGTGTYYTINFKLDYAS